MTKIVLELDYLEAHLLGPAISNARLEASKAMAEAETETAREYADVRRAVLGRVESALVDAMYPEPKVTEYL